MEWHCILCSFWLCQYQKWWNRLMTHFVRSGHICCFLFFESVTPMLILELTRPTNNLFFFAFTKRPVKFIVMGEMLCLHWPTWGVANFERLCSLLCRFRWCGCRSVYPFLHSINYCMNSSLHADSYCWCMVLEMVWMREKERQCNGQMHVIIMFVCLLFLFFKYIFIHLKKH